MTIRRATGCLILVVGCDPAPPAALPPSDLPTMTVAVGSSVVTVPFDEVRCTPATDARLIELFYPAAVPDGRDTAQRPRTLVARLRGEDVLEAHAFVPRARFVEMEYDMVVLVTGPAAPDAQCRLEQAGPQTTIACNYATIVPWLDATPRPEPSFKVSFQCP